MHRPRPWSSGPPIALLLLGAMAGGDAGPARAADLPTLRGDHQPYFSAEVNIATMAEGQPGLSVTVSIPYRDLQWLRIPRGYAGGAEIMVSFEPHDRGREYGDFWERRIVVPSFGLTVSPNAMLVEKRNFPVTPEHYTMRVAVRDLNSGSGSSAQQSLTVPDYSKIPLGFTDLELGLVDSSGVFSPTPTRRFGYEVGHLAARVTLFDRRSGSWPRNYQFRYRILDETGEEIMAGNQPVALNRSAEPVVVRPGSSDLFLGTYTLEVALADSRSKIRVDRSFEVEQSGPPPGKEFDRVLEALSYIADAREIDALRALPPDQRARGWDEFWRRRDPTPDTPRNEAMIEFFRRVRYAEQHFQGAGPGWRSDMGRIYIKFGPPDQVENHAATSQSPQIEIWYYNHPYRRLVFEDRDGFGRYVLSNPSAE